MKKSATILIVDDNRLFRETLREILYLVCPYWQVIEASNGLDGAELAQSSRPDLIFLDFHMPIMNGYELVVALQKQAETRAIPLILMTSADAEHPLISRMHAFCLGVLFKPFSLKELEHLLERVANPKSASGLSTAHYANLPIVTAF